VSLEALGGRLQMFLELQKQRKCVWEFDQLRRHKMFGYRCNYPNHVISNKNEHRNHQKSLMLETQSMVHQYLITLLYYNGFPLVSFNQLIPR
jgi:hypothetical protein